MASVFSTAAATRGGLGSAIIVTLDGDIHPWLPWPNICPPAISRVPWAK